MSRRPARCTQADIKRALQAARSINASVSVEILPDGTIRLTPLPPQNSYEAIGATRKIVL